MMPASFPQLLTLCAFLLLSCSAASDPAEKKAAAAKPPSLLDAIDPTINPRVDLTVPAVKSRLHRARLALREKLGEFFDAPAK